MNNVARLFKTFRDKADLLAWLDENERAMNRQLPNRELPLNLAGFTSTDANDKHSDDHCGEELKTKPASDLVYYSRNREYECEKLLSEFDEVGKYDAAGEITICVESW